MRTLSSQALREAVTAKATSDAAFAAELRADPQKAIESRFGKQPYAIKTIQEQPGELSLLVPNKTVALEQVVNRGVADLGSRKPTSGELGAIVAQKAWNDGAFATQLAQDARKALEAVLKAYDVAVPAGKTVRAYFESATECVVIIPAAASSQELTDEELEAVAGGEELVLAATAIVTVAVAETLCS